MGLFPSDPSDQAFVRQGWAGKPKHRRSVGRGVLKLGPENGPQLQLTQPNSLDMIGSVGQDSAC